MDQKILDALTFYADPESYASAHNGPDVMRDLGVKAKEALERGGPADYGDHQQLYAEFWQELVETNGVLDQEKVARELADYYHMMNQVSIAYDGVTHGRISKPNTMARHVIEAVEQLTTEAVEEALAEAKEQP